MKKKQIQINQDTFISICKFFDLIDNQEEKENLQSKICFDLNQKIESIKRRFAYQDMQKSKGTEDFEDALLNYLKF